MRDIPTVFKELNVGCVQVVVSLKQLLTWWGKDDIFFTSYIHAEEEEVIWSFTLVEVLTFYTVSIPCYK